MKLDVSHAMPDPTEEGSYAAEVYFGWKLLDWKDGQWWHENCSGRWPLEVVQWVKLPEAIYWIIEDDKPSKSYDL
jgi:hypothetical protein